MKGLWLIVACDHLPDKHSGLVVEGSPLREVVRVAMTPPSFQNLHRRTVVGSELAVRFRLGVGSSCGKWPLVAFRRLSASHCSTCHSRKRSDNGLNPNYS